MLAAMTDTEPTGAGTPAEIRHHRWHRLSGWRPDAVVFDCDGLLADTEPRWTVAETRLFAHHGLPFGPAQKALLIGTSTAEAGEIMAGLFGLPGQGPALGADLLALAVAVISAQALPMHGAVKVVELVSGRVPVAVASNSPRHLLNITLDRSGFAGTFPVSVAGDEVARAKPAPDLYLAACAALAAEPQACLAFEDSITGLRAAQAAGLRTVAVPSLPQDLPADLVINSLTDPDLLAWIETW
jgi:HAD superfamily hydrolase (TIGR01509 family)